MSKSKAYDEVYDSRGGKNRNTRQVAAVQEANKPGIKALIAEYEAQLMPIGDMRECRQRMLANMQHLAYHAKDERVRITATKMLHDICEAREQQEESLRQAPLTIDSLITEIRQLEAPEPTMEMETVEEGAPEASDESPTERAVQDQEPSASEA